MLMMNKMNNRAKTRLLCVWTGDRGELRGDDRSVSGITGDLKCFYMAENILLMLSIWSYSLAAWSVSSCWSWDRTSLRAASSRRSVQPIKILQTCRWWGKQQTERVSVANSDLHHNLSHWCTRLKVKVLFTGQLGNDCNGNPDEQNSCVYDGQAGSSWWEFSVFKALRFSFEWNLFWVCFFFTSVPFSTAMSLHSWYIKATQPIVVQVST